MEITLDELLQGKATRIKDNAYLQKKYKISGKYVRD